jgi:hypothetical protein
MLSRYEGKTIRLTTNDGEVFTGEAQAFPAGYTLDTFGVEEESVCIGDTFFFLSQIARIEPPTGFAVTDADRARYDELTRTLLELPYRIVDALPQPVPDDAGGQYFMIDRYFRQPPQLSVLRRRQARLLLRMNCYADMAVTADGGESWEKNPGPAQFVRTLDGLSGERFLRVLFPSMSMMIELCAGDTQMTATCPENAPTQTLRALAAAEGLFLWDPQED